MRVSVEPLCSRSRDAKRLASNNNWSMFVSDESSLFDVNVTVRHFVFTVHHKKPLARTALMKATVIEISSNRPSVNRSQDGRAV